MRGMITRRFNWTGDAEFEFRNVLDEASRDYPRNMYREGEPGEIFLSRCGRRDEDRFLPCSISTAALGVDKEAPPWTLQVAACGRGRAENTSEATVTIGELAAGARDHLHDQVLDLVKNGIVLHRDQ